MSHFSHQRSLATELTTFHLENKTQTLVIINKLRCLIVSGNGSTRVSKKVAKNVVVAVAAAAALVDVLHEKMT